jgi:hypothetical protein
MYSQGKRRAISFEKIGWPLSDPGMYSQGQRRAISFEKIGWPLSDPGLDSQGQRRAISFEKIGWLFLLRYIGASSYVLKGVLFC